MDHDIELRFQKLQKHPEKDFCPGMDMSTFLFLVGVSGFMLGVFVLFCDSGFCGGFGSITESDVLCSVLISFSVHFPQHDH